MDTFKLNEITFYHGPHAVGFASNGPATAAGAIRRIRERGMTGLRVLDLCCGVGVVGLLMRKELGTDVITHLTLADVNVFNLYALTETLKANGLKSSDIELRLSDGLWQLRRSDRFDLIVSNPPHCPWPEEEVDITPSWLATCDNEWEFHRAFYRHVHHHLFPGGESWMLENGINGMPEHVGLEFIAANPEIEYAGREDEPEDPGFFWMMIRTATNMVHGAQRRGS